MDRLSYLGPGFSAELNATRNAPAPVPNPEAVVDSSDEPVMNAVRARNRPPVTKVAKKSTKRASCVYFIRNNVNNLVKIGLSICMARRLQALQTAVGDTKLVVEDRILATPAEARAIEKIIHDTFERQRKYGEWFDVSRNKIKVFLGVLRGGCLLETAAGLRRLLVERPKRPLVRRHSRPHPDRGERRPTSHTRRTTHLGHLRASFYFRARVKHLLRGII